ncbi:hypothetical protein [Ruania halotolerans]|uniref:hypothetical protein n=1 Tax=Ruania halotolerans TaxID=2897773 RepID=UPI001E4FE62E|nr:hypothetical protein [Ruania halotolerans]UFU06411.1 hypothetical protein LQF10_18625 [Ruania halotolerans]
MAWSLVFGLAALTLLWPLTSVIGLAEAIGNPTRALLLIALTGGAWIGVVGFGHAVRPIATLTLTGLVAGAITLVASIVVTGLGAESGGLSAVPTFALPLVAVEMVGSQTLLGLLAGLAAAGVQRVRGTGTQRGTNR